jgi:hypothetical protein
MLLFQKRFLAGLVDGSITVTFRQWDKPKVKPGGRYRVHPIGVVEVDAIDRVPLGKVTASDARKAGFASRAELLDYLRPAAKSELTPESEIFRIRLRHAGEADYVAGALDEQLTAEDRATIKQKLARLDTPTPWTRRTLSLIAAHPHVAASQLAKKLGRETAPFKADVVKLKKLGLTQSFEVGYDLTPRGRAYLAR